MTRSDYRKGLGLGRDALAPKKDEEVDAHAGLIAYLEKNFAYNPPTVDINERQLWMNVGREQVVEHFRVLHKRQYNP